MSLPEGTVMIDCVAGQAMTSVTEATGVTPSIIAVSTSNRSSEGVNLFIFKMPLRTKES